MSGLAVVTCALLVALLADCDAAPSRLRRRPSPEWLHMTQAPPPEPNENHAVESFWVVQDVDHFNESIGATWQQRYFQNAEYYQPGGPVFVFISGNEKANPSWIESSFVSELAKQHNALLLELEHRYYGDSQPTPDLSSENLQYLSVEQALEDFLHFKWHVNGQNSALIDAKWVVFGGGYGGNLAAWIRDRFHFLIDGAVVSGAPVLAQPNYSGYLRISGEAISSFDPDCYAEINAASQEFEELLKSDSGVSSISQWFGLCEPLDVSKEYDVATLYSLVSSHFAGLALYNNVSEGGPSDLERECAVLRGSEGDSPLRRLSRYLGLESAEYCVDPSYDRLLEQYKSIQWDKSGGRQWLYQMCTEFGFWQTTDSPFQPFGHRLNIFYFSNVCPEIFGPEFTSKLQQAGIAEINQKYGGKHPGASNVVYVYGGFDPWRELGALDHVGSYVYKILLENLSHCQDLKLPSSLDVPQLKAARDRIGQLVEQWIS